MEKFTSPPQAGLYISPKQGYQITIFRSHNTEGSVGGLQQGTRLHAQQKELTKYREVCTRSVIFMEVSRKVL